jgi:hypothetical protein
VVIILHISLPSKNHLCHSKTSKQDTQSAHVHK